MKESWYFVSCRQTPELGLYTLQLVAKYSSGLDAIGWLKVTAP